MTWTATASDEVATARNGCPGMIEVLAWVALAYNTLVAIGFAYDKWQAKRSGPRVSERTLLGLATLFGAAGALLSMQVTRHKTRKPKFRIGVPILLCLQLGSVLAWWFRSRA